MGLRIAQRRTGQRLLPAQLLGWYPRAVISSATLEALISHGEGNANERTLKMVRIAVSSIVECPFCVGMNSSGWEQHVTYDELTAIQSGRDPHQVATFTPAERLAIDYARILSRAPLAVPTDLGERLTNHFTPREVVILATTIAQVNYWARLIQGLGCQPEF